jgi:hypothetical protein
MPIKSSANFLKFYTSLWSEVSGICDCIDSHPSEKVCIVCNDYGGRFHSAISAELAYRGIKCEGCMGQREYACAAALEIFRHWSLWQLNRNVFAFVKFYQDLVAQEICHLDEFAAVNKKINSLLYRHLTSNCDVIFTAIESDKYLQRFLMQYDLKGKKVSILEFLSLICTIFGELLPESVLDELRGEFAPYDQLNCENLEILIKVVELALRESDCEKQNCSASGNVCILNARAGACGRYSLCVCSLTNLQNLDKFTEYILNKKNCIIFCTAKSCDDIPSHLRRVFFSFTGSILTADDFQKFSAEKNHTKIQCTPEEDVLQTKVAYDSRRNTCTEFDEYSYMLDLENAHRIACKTVEILLKNPTVAFYDHVLKLEGIYSHLDVELNGKILLGSVVHELLNVSERCCSMPTSEQFYSLIDKKWKKLWDGVALVHSAADVGVSYFALEIFQLAKYMAYKFANKIISMGYKFMATEVDPPNRTMSAKWLGDFALAGRVDCILSNKNFELNPDAAVNIFDFKTSNYDMLSVEKISSQLAEYIGIQVYMYGLVYKNAGFSGVGVQILRCDCGDVSPIGVDVFLGKSERIFAELSRIFQSGILGEKTIKNFSDATNLPIVTVTLPDDIVEKKLRIT